MNKLKPVAVGPHTGLYDLPFQELPRPVRRPQFLAEEINLSLLVSQIGKALTKEFLREKFKEVESDHLDLEVLDHGALVLIKFSVRPENIPDSIINEELGDWESSIAEAFANAHGDEDIYDAVPLFYDCYERALQVWGMDKRIRNFRQLLFEIDDEFPDFFTDEEKENF